MKTVFKYSSELAHIFAHKHQASGGTPLRKASSNCSGRGHDGRSAFFEGDFYYSYGKHYCLARHLPDGYVAINLEKSTVTTERQKWELRNATRHLKQILVLEPDQCSNSRDRTRNYVHDLIEQAAKAKSDGRRPGLLAQAQKVTEDFNTFCDLLKLPERKIEPPVTDPAALAELKKTLLHLAKQEKAREKLREQAIAESHAKQIDDWRKGLINHVPYAAATMLRVNGDTIDTSKGAHIPVADAIRLWPVIVRVMLGSKDYEVGMDLGGYQLTKIRRDGSILVNCHDIPYPEIQAVAVTLGLLKVEET